MVSVRLLIVMMLISASLAGCAAPGGSFCDVASPIRTPIADMTVAEQRAALAHNLTGAKLCGWQP